MLKSPSKILFPVFNERVVTNSEVFYEKIRVKGTVGGR